MKVYLVYETHDEDELKLLVAIYDSRTKADEHTKRQKAVFKMRHYSIREWFVS